MKCLSKIMNIRLSLSIVYFCNLMSVPHHRILPPVQQISFILPHMYLWT
jgi:hypothetical protein